LANWLIIYLLPYQLYADVFTLVLHTFSFVWLRLAQTTDLCSYLAKQLLVYTFQENPWVITFFL
jgi:hypothetical protein